MTISKAWSDTENSAIAALYFYMLARVLRGVKFNKRALIRIATGTQVPGDIAPNCGAFVQQISDTRSRQSVEAKLMNCTAVHELLDPTAMSMSAHGYRPLTRFQGALRDAMSLAHRAYIDDRAQRIESAERAS